jgi:hypothetical protein
VGALTKEQIDAAAEDALRQGEAQGLPRTVDDPAQLERLSAIMGAAIEQSGQSPRR